MKETQPRSPKTGARKRAAKACLRCRTRKVRCDVTRTVQPCTNCRLDGLQCTVLPRARKHDADQDAKNNDAKPAWEADESSSPDSSQGTDAYRDLSFLEMQGCFQFPDRPVLDDFMRQYFLHVHPMLPLLNEGDFWDAYEKDGESAFPPMLLQAMMFTSCTYVSEESIQTLGFPNIRMVKTSFYTKAQLLYDYGIKKDNILLTQVALLLTHWCQPTELNERPNNTWLRVAIRHARAAGADDSADNKLKRIWCCCIIRDRTISLGLRRPIQIRQHWSSLACDDLSDEIDRSRVYPADTKRRLAEVVAIFTELCDWLTDVLDLVYPVDLASQTSVEENREALELWSFKAKPILSTPCDDNTVLYSNLVWMYYHTARIALCNYELFGFTSSSPDSNKQLRHASTSIVNCLKQLLDFGLAHWLPNSAVGFTALPLALHMLDIKLSRKPPEARIETQGRLNILIQAMKEYHARNEGVDWVSKAIRYFMESTNLDMHLDGDDILVTSPPCYLRMAFTIDLSLSKVRLPEEKDYPTMLGSSLLELTDVGIGDWNTEFDWGIPGWIQNDRTLYFAQEMGLGPDLEGVDAEMDIARRAACEWYLSGNKLVK